MIPGALLLVKWMLACGGCLVVGLLVRMMLGAAARRWPALLSRRAVWIAAQGVIAASALLPFLPQAPLKLVPQLTLSVPQQIAPTLPSKAPRQAASLPSAAPYITPALASATGPGTLAATSTTSQDRATPAQHHSPALALPPQPEALAAASAPPPSRAMPAPASFVLATAALGAAGLPAMAVLWLLVYGAGLAHASLRLLRARRLWRGLLASARPAHLRDAPRGLSVMTTSAAISPMLAGVRRPVLLLPDHLSAFSVEQQQMILAHELHHWRVRDPLWLGIASLLRAVFWFNPALPWLAERMAWAMELSCDQQVLAGRPQHQRKQYAASLLQQWKMATLPAHGAAFGRAEGMDVAARIQQMQHSALPALPRAAAWLTGAMMMTALGSAVMLQPALAFGDGAQAGVNGLPPSVTATSATSTARPWRAPLDNMRVTSFFGVHRDVLPTPHKGIDLSARKGTPVHAAADGVVSVAGPLAENQGRYGNAVIIDHGGQQSLYAHLDSIAVAPGQRIAAGQVIGAVGATGFATGPHLHFEVREGDRIIDPATRLSDLDNHATRHALKLRDQQLPRKG